MNAEDWTGEGRGQKVGGRRASKAGAFARSKALSRSLCKFAVGLRPAAGHLTPGHYPTLEEQQELGLRLRLRLREGLVAGEPLRAAQRGRRTRLQPYTRNTALAPPLCTDQTEHCGTVFHTLSFQCEAHTESRESETEKSHLFDFVIFVGATNK